MAILDYISIGWTNGWWFTAVFGLVNLYFLARFSKRFPRRMFRFPPFKSTFERVISMASVVVFMRGMMIFTIFVSIDIGTVWFYFGSAVYLTGLFFYIGAMKAYAETTDHEPVVSGVYRISRHPMQVFSLIMWVGVGIATANWIILIICCVQPFLVYRFLIAQERFCLDVYGETYQKYLQVTPRYLFI